MPTTIPGAARSTSWNVQLYVDFKLIAGVLQHSDLINVADLAHELELCLDLDENDALWQPALLPRATESADRRFIVLDHQDEHPISTPSKVDAYTHLISYLRTAADSFETSVFDSPEVLNIAAVRKKHRITFNSPSPRKSSPSSPGQANNPDEPRKFKGNFRDNVLDFTYTCVITGKGTSWFSRGVGPDLEAAHIVPQIHWHTFPISSDGPEFTKTIDQLTSAWTLTWE
ncbi:hypothetical protein SLS53_003863 [Cytospora paraplurivora]|uniref:HNH nuclease domain-containing protein n=1 Tax=Cytospora paraplurivora TaxID=2898453 RepID=A0AAN9U902_9PEZI